MAVMNNDADKAESGRDAIFKAHNHVLLIKILSQNGFGNWGKLGMATGASFWISYFIKYLLLQVL